MTTFVVLCCDECQRDSGTARLADDMKLQGWIETDGRHLCPTCAWVAAPPSTALHWKGPEA